MKRKLSLILGCILLICSGLTAQYVNIPDSNFRNALIVKYPTCFNAAKQLDTTCSAILNETSLALYATGALSIAGIQYFKNLNSFYCNGEAFTIIQTLPATLQTLSMDNCQIQKIRSLPAGMQTISINFSKLDSLPTLPTGLKSLVVSSAKLTSLPALNASLKKLDCNSNLNLHSLPPLPSGLTYLFCAGCGLSVLPALPSALDTLYAVTNQLTVLPAIPASIKYLDCTDNQITSLPAINSFLSLTTFFCRLNYLTTIPTLPPNLEQFDCGNNSITSLPQLPSKLKSLGCDHNQLQYLPVLPDSLISLYAHNNNLTALAAVPKKLTTIWVDNNPNLTCLPYLPNATYEVKIGNTGILCLPNIPPNCQFLPAALSICNPSNNTYQCQTYPQMNGLVYNDNNNNGIKDNGDVVRQNAKVVMSNGAYAYTNANGIYDIAADTIGSYSVTIVSPSFYNAIPLSFVHNFSSYSNIIADTFVLKANTVKDSLAIHITRFNRARPGFAFAYCVSYENAGTTILSPRITVKYDPNNLVYDSASIAGIISNADSLFINPAILLPGETKSFTAYFTVKTTAVLGAFLQAVAGASAGTISASDFLWSNIFGSHDPNNKEATPEMTPAQVASGNYIDYTIHFQNTGNDTAINVVLADTLNGLLQNNVLQILISSHLCRTTLTNGIVYFEFLNVNLPDSNINKLGSNGFVRFRIKPDSNVAVGDVIPNKASIYFDYNAAIATNTCQTFIRSTVMPVSLLSYTVKRKKDEQILNEWVTANELNTSLFNVQRSKNGKDFITIGKVQAKARSATREIYSYADEAFESIEGGKLYYRLEIVDNDGTKVYSAIQTARFKSANDVSVYPNPTHDVVTVEATNLQSIRLTDNAGRVIISKEAVNQSQVTMPVKNLSKGVYLLQVVTTSGNTKTQKLVIE